MPVTVVPHRHAFARAAPHRPSRWRPFALSVCAALALVAADCRAQSAPEPDAREEAAGSPLADAPLADYQNQLLDLAFQTATAIPLDPHLRNRARAQEAVVAACLELDQPRRALRCIEQIPNWRRGLAYADLAYYCAQHGYVPEAGHYIELAGEIAGQAESWRKDRIRVRMAQTHAWLGQVEEATELERGLTESETGKISGARAAVSDDDSFDVQIMSIDRQLAKGHFDITRNTLESSTELFNRFYDSPERRSAVEDKIKSSWEPLPIFLRIQLLMKLAGFALEHGDQGKAVNLVNEAQLILEGAQWRAEHVIPLKAELVKLRYRAGDAEKARTDADAALALFETDREEILSIDRADIVRALAEAYRTMGDTAKALAVYKRAVEEGVVNPNPKPRAEDLSATCSSMALHEVEPDAPLWGRMREISEGLEEPW